MAKRKNYRRGKQKGVEKRKSAQRSGLFWGIGIVAAVVGILLFTFSGNSSSSQPSLSNAEVADLPIGLQIGARAPDFSLNTGRGSKAALSDFRGKPLAIMFFHSW